MNDDSRPLGGDEEISEMTMREVIDQYDKRRIAAVHGDRYTPVCGYARVEGGFLGLSEPVNPTYFLKDCYGDEIPTTLATAGAVIRVLEV